MGTRINNKPLNDARLFGSDEFYTLSEDIEKELCYYKDCFAGKTVYCNCDDPYESNFVRYFINHFNDLGLAKLVATGYHFKGKRRMAYKAVVTKVDNEDLDDIDAVFAADGNKVVSLGGRGNFMSEANQKLLRKADIVVTNPPFSMFKEYVDNLIENKKQFLILGNITAITYKNIFSHISSDKMWCGYGFNMMTVFRTPGFRESIASNRSFVKFKGYNPDQGYRKVSGITWFTNLSSSKRNDFYEFTKEYNPEDYYRYDNFDAIDVPRVKDIPCDYEGVMGVPVTFLEVYNPEQFELIGTGKGKQGKAIGMSKNYRGRHDLTYTDKDSKKHCPFGRILIRKSTTSK